MNRAVAARVPLHRVDDASRQQGAEQDTKPQQGAEHPRGAVLAEPVDQATALAGFRQNPRLVPQADQAENCRRAANEDLVVRHGAIVGGGAAVCDNAMAGVSVSRSTARFLPAPDVSK